MSDTSFEQTGNTPGGWDFLRETLRQNMPDVAPAFIDKMVNAWNTSGSTNYNDPSAAQRAADRVSREWSNLATGDKNKWANTLTNDQNDAVNKSADGTPDTTPERLGALYDRTGKQIIDNTAARTQAQRDTYNQGSAAALAGLQSANDKATQDTNAALAGLRSSGDSTKATIDALIAGLASKQASTDAAANQSLGQLQGDYGKFTSERDRATKDYLEQLAPLQKQMTAQGYTGVSTSADDISRLIDSFTKSQGVYDRYSALSSPEMTAKERAILDAANRSWSQADKSARDADARELMSRGVYSGGAAVAQQLARGQQLGQERVAATIQAQGSAVDRALQALAGMRGTAGDMSTAANQIRTGNDAMLHFNASQRGITQRFQDQYQQDEAKRLQGLAQGQVDTTLGKTSGDFAASGQLNSAQQDALDRAFGRQTQTTNTGLTGAQNKYAIDSGIAGDQVTAANNEANRASNLSGAQLTDTQNKTNLIGSTGKDEDEALKYLLGIQAEKANLAKNGVKI